MHVYSSELADVDSVKIDELLTYEYYLETVLHPTNEQKSCRQTDSCTQIVHLVDSR